MDTSPPPQPPYGTLIEIARKGVHLSVQAAADRAGVSKATWIDNVRGYRKRGGQWESVNPKPETIADMAGAVGISPERLASEGRHPGAAEILEEMGREQASSLPLSRIGPPEPADDFPQEALRAFGPAAEPIRREIAGRAETAAAAHGIDVTAPGAALQGAWVFPRDPVLAAQWDRLTSSGISLRGIVQIMAIWREDEARNNPGRGQGAAGLTPRSALPPDTSR